MGRTRRKKKRTQNPLQSEGELEKVPRSFVIAKRKLPPLLRQLHHDLRKLMLPHTALHLKEKKKNSMKDFLHVAGPLGVTHFLILSHTDKASYLKVARCPRGPTLTFKIHSYALDADIARTQFCPRAPAGLFKNSPLIVLAGFGGEGEHLKLITTMFQNIFPAIDVNTVKLATCQRVVLLNYDKETKHIEFRHYSITLQPVGVSRPLRKLVQNRKIPDLRGLGDVSEFVTKAGYGSESEAEDDAATVQLSSDIGHLNYKSQKNAVKLQEIGPRMTLQLVKVEEGLCSGAIMFHEYVNKTPEEIAELEESKEKREALRKQRRAEQEANVRKKEILKQSQRARSKANQNEMKDTNLEVAVDADDIDDTEWYRQEVGQEPDAEFMTGMKKRSQKTHAGIQPKKRRKHTQTNSKLNQSEMSSTKERKGAPPKVGFHKTGKGVAHEILSQRKRKQKSTRFLQSRKKHRTE